MKMRSLKASAILSCLLGPIAWGAAPATTQPEATTQPAPGTYEAFHVDAQATQKRYLALVPNNDFLADTNPQRSAVAADACAILRQQIIDMDGMIRTKPGNKWPILAVHFNTEAELYALGDRETVTTLEHQATLQGRDAIRARRMLLKAHWLMAGDDSDKQTKVMSDLDQLAQSDSGDLALTQVITDIALATQDPDVRQHMVDLLTNTMDNMSADAQVRLISNHDKVHSFQGKPIVIAGKTPDGRDFTTADWKGKVVLVDFWAAWCEPCKEELPRVKNVYNQYHDKGLEVLGVDNDYTAKSLMAYSAQAKLSWPQLFDAAAAAQSAWNPVTVHYGIDGIPVMFLIDKKGVCRTVSARADFEHLIPQMLAE